MANKSICESCISFNGGCCSSVRFTVHINEASPFIERFSNGATLEGHIFKKLTDRVNQYLYTSTDKPCVFLKKDNRCEIYENRPLICRMYPLLWKFNTNKDANIFIDLTCPLGYEKPVKEILKWASEKTNIKQMKKMGSLDFDGRYRNYSNFTSLKSEYEALKLLDTEP